MFSPYSGGKGMKRYTAGLLLCVTAFLLSFCCVSAEQGTVVTLRENDWTWQGSSTAGFDGTVTFETQPADKILMKLSFSASPEATEQGEVLFYEINENKLTIRKQKPEYTYTFGDEKTISFTGNWKTPESVYFTRVNIKLQVFSEDGNTLYGEGNLSVSRDASEISNPDDGKFRLNLDLSSWTIWIFAGAAAVWLAAILRVIVNRKKG